jgi:hypothetical protein
MDSTKILKSKQKCDLMRFLTKRKEEPERELRNVMRFLTKYTGKRKTAR